MRRRIEGLEQQLAQHEAREGASKGGSDTGDGPPRDKASVLGSQDSAANVVEGVRGALLLEERRMLAERLKRADEEEAAAAEAKNRILAEDRARWVSELSTKVTEWRDKHAVAESALREARKQLRELGQRSEERDEEVAALQKQLRDLREELAKEQSVVQATRADRAREEAERLALERRAATEKRELEDVLARLEAKVQSTELGSEDQRKHTERAQESLRLAREEVGSLQLRLQRSKEELKASRVELDRVSNEAEEYKGGLAKAELTVQVLRGEGHEYRREAEAHKEELQKKLVEVR